MQRPLKITARDFELSEAIEKEIREKATGLDLYCDRLTGCDVVIEAPVGHHRRGGPFKIRVNLSVPRSRLSVTRQSDEDLTVAIREAFDAARRRLEDYARRLRGDIKSRVAQPIGQVNRLFADHGFLEAGDGREIYFHRNSVLGNRFDALTVGSRVRFVEEEGEQGAQASTVDVIGRSRNGHQSAS